MRGTQRHRNGISRHGFEAQIPDPKVIAFPPRSGCLILNSRREEITRFLDGLESEVSRVLDANPDPKTAALRDELKKAEANARALGVQEEDLAMMPKVKELRAELATGAPTDPALLQHELFSHLTTFFSRYYKDGDFLSLRRYKGDTYAIPYQGEEVKLHWANADQYYIKSAENFRDYTFTLGSREDGVPTPRVSFKLIQADTERDNTKAVAGQERRFIYHSVVSRTEDHLVLGFEYRPLTEAESGGPDAEGEEGETTGKKKKKKVTQATLNQDAVAAILKDCAHGPFIGLAAPMPTEKNKTRTLLEKRLADYTARNTFDYFIHKDLGGFLRRELDFYVKNEVLHLDDIESAGQGTWETQLQKIKTLRAIAHRIIRFLAQIEDFQRKLWLKKKFVVGCDYVLTLDRIPESLYPEICANDAQWQEWDELFALPEPKQTTEFLKANPYLMLDTRHFPREVNRRLLSSIENLEECINGVCFHSENFQALQVMQARYQERVKCVYIDPPYNTASSEILYKNNYKHSSWVTLMRDRIDLLAKTMSRDGAIFVSIDNHERSNLEHAMSQVLGADNHIEELIWSMNTNNSQAPNYSTNHEYVLVYAKDRVTAENDKDMFREPKPGFAEVMELVARLNPEFPKVTDIQEELRKLYEQHRIELREEIEAQGLEWEDEKGNDPWKGLYNYSHAEYRDANGVFVEESEARERKAIIRIWQEDNTSMPATKQAESTRDPSHPNWRFYNPLHPKTGKPCPHPKSGWKFAFDDDADSPDKRSLVSLDRDHRIAWGPDEKKVPRIKRMLHEVETNIGKSVFSDYSDGEKQTSALFGKSGMFLAPKHASFVSRFILHSARKDSVVLDCFGGSGSTAHAVITTNRNDHGSRKYVTAEMGSHFDTIIVPRLKKVVYSADWKAGKPQAPETGISHCFKVLRLESYEDTLNNLRLTRSAAQEGALKLMDADQQDAYRLGYMLDVEAEGSASLLNVSAFTDPWDYTLDIASGSAGETRPTKVDLVETYHWLIGLTVTSQRYVEAPKSRKKSATTSGPMLCLSEGTNPAGERVLVIWRKQVLITSQGLNDWLTEDGLAARLGEFTEVHVNGDHHLDLLRGKGQTWTARLIDDLFPKLMWEGAE